ncbi:DMT family transporter [Sanyastnella coralliicola]|uniref:DMT family transporter n=1 Tax=Sanyastnella coralliicola TaxID=3069118 RepID=UPI0027BA1633|nr:DMT family transporter [Longitalea sp. SCSIO 12813]
MRLDGVGMMLISVVLFTTANVFVKEIAFLPSTQIVFMRSVVSLILCSAFVLYKGFPYFGNNKKWLIIRGVFGMIALTLFFYTIQNIPLASATVIQYLSPVFTVILAMLWLGQRVRRIQWVFLALAILGVIMVKGFDPNVPVTFLLIGSTSAFLAAVAYIATIKCKDTDHPVSIVMYFHLIATPVMGGISTTNWEPIGMTEWWYGIAIGVLSVLAQIAMAFAIMKEDASVVTPFKYVGAILALAIGYFRYDEVLNPLSILGIFLVIGGVTLNILAKRYHW